MSEVERIATKSKSVSMQREYERFPLSYRVEHWLQFIAFTTLAITGLVQKFASTGISKSIIETLGGIERTRIIHHTAAIILMIEVVYHIGSMGYRVYVKRHKMSMLPTGVDVRNAVQTFLFNLGLVKNRPQQGRYTFEEKAEYWAFVWGTVIMVITGFMMWNPVATTRFLPGQFIPAAKAAHGGEAILAVLAIFVWHIYQVHLKTFNKSIFTGKMSEHQMVEEHPLELADIKAGTEVPPSNPALEAQRQKIFFPTYGAIAIVLLFGIYRFVTFEHTAITTLPPAETVVVFAPLTPTPFPTLAPTPTSPPAPTSQPGGATQSLAWNSGVSALFQDKCSGCHNSTAKTAGLDLTSYAGLTAGAASGPVIIPGNADGSQLIQVQAAGGHPGQFTPEELAQVKSWVQAGAPENAAAASQQPAASGTSQPGNTAAPTTTYTWDFGIASILQQTCGGCHNSSVKRGGLDLTTYGGIAAAAQTGMIVPGNAEASKLVQVQAAGGHPGELSSDELSRVKDWIQAGAPESAKSGPLPAATPSPSAVASASTTPEAATAPAVGQQGPTWDTSIGAVLQGKCTTCHDGGSRTAGLDLSTYAGLMAGASSGPVVVPGDPTGSKLVQVQATGGHPAELSAEELALVKEWIQASAPEKPGASGQSAAGTAQPGAAIPGAAIPGAATQPPAAAASLTWDAVASLFQNTCGACHNSTAKSAGLDLTSFAGITAGAASGPVIVPSNADGSKLVQVQSAGGHPGQFSAEDLAKVKEWIQAGALEK